MIDANVSSNRTEYNEIISLTQWSAGCTYPTWPALRDDAENYAWPMEGRGPAVIVNIQRNPAQNVIEVVDRIKRYTQTAAIFPIR